MGSVGYSFLDLWIFSAKCKWPLKPLKRKRTLVLFFPTNSNLTKAKKLWQQLQVLSHKNSLKHNTGCLNNKMVFMICLRSGLWIKGNEIIRAPNPEMLLSEHPDTGHVLIPGVNKAYSFLTSFLSKLNSSNYWNCLVNLSRSITTSSKCWCSFHNHFLRKHLHNFDYFSARGSVSTLSLTVKSRDSYIS